MMKRAASSRYSVRNKQSFPASGPSETWQSRQEEGLTLLSGQAHGVNNAEKHAASTEDGDKKLRTAPEVIAQRLRGAAYTAFAALARVQMFSNKLWVFLQFVAFLQLLSFPLSPLPIFGWCEEPMMSSLSSVLSVLSLTSISSFASKALQFDAFAGACAWMLCVLSFALFIGLLAYQEKRFSSLSLKVLRSVLLASSTIFFLPSMYSAFQVYQCSGTWLTTGWTCFTGLHILLLIGVSLLSLAYLALLFMMCLCCYGQSQNADNFSSRSHGRVDAVVLALKATLCLSFVLSEVLHRNVLVGIVAFCSLVYVYAYFTYQPFLNPLVNQAHSSCAAVFFWASVCLVLMVVRNTPKVNVESFVLYFGIPSVAYAAWGLTGHRFAKFDEEVVDLSDVFTVELRARRLLYSAGITPGTVATFRRTPDTSSGRFDIEFEERRRAFRAVELLYAEALDTFPGSARLHWNISQYVHTYKGNRHVEQLHLLAAENKSPGIDVAFQVRLRRDEVRMEDDNNGSGSMTVASRIKFEKLKSESDELMLRAREKQVEFWGELANAVPSLDKLHTIGKSIEDHLNNADKTFQRMLTLNPNSVVTLRRYARFLCEISNNPVKASKLNQQADDIEDTLSKEHADLSACLTMFAKGSSLDASREDVGVITIGQTASDLGTIQSANPVALKVFGYTRRDLLGRNINTLVPEPLATVHQQFMLRYISTGRETVMNTTRTAFGKHRQGYIFPLLLNVKAMESSFAGILQELTTEDQFILFLSHSFTVMEATQDSLKLMGVTGQELAEGDITLERFIPRDSLVGLLETAAASERKGKNKFKRYPVPVRNVHKTYLSHKAAMGLISKDAEKEGAVKIMGRLQITRFTKEGWMLSDADDNAHDGHNGPADSGERLVVLTWTLQEVNSDGSAVEGKYDPGMTQDIASSLDAPCIVAQPFTGVTSTLSSDSTKLCGTESHVTALLHTVCGSDSPSSRDSDASDEPTFETTKSTSTDLSSEKKSADMDKVGATKSAQARKSVEFPDNDGKTPRKSKSSKSSKVLPVDDSTMEKEDKMEKIGAAPSVSSSTNSRATTSAFHKAIDRGSAIEESTLKLLRRLLLAVSLVIVVFAVTLMMMSEKLIKDGVDAAGVLVLGGYREQTLQMVTMLTAVLIVCSADLPTIHTFNDTVKKLGTNVVDLNAVHNNLLINHPPTLASQVSLLKTQVFLTARLYNGQVAFRNQTFTDMVSEFIADAQVISKDNQSMVTMEDPDVYFVMANSLLIANKMNSSNVLRYNTKIDDLQTAKVPVNVVCYVVLGVLAAYILFVVLPVSYKVENERLHIMTIFMQVPVVAVRRLHRQAEKGVEDLRAAMENENGDSDDERENREGGEVRTCFEAFFSNSNFKEDLVWSEIGQVSSNRDLKKSSFTFLALFTKLSLPFLVCLGVFIGCNLYTTDSEVKVQADYFAVFLGQQRLTFAISSEALLLQMLMSTDNNATETLSATTLKMINGLVFVEQELYVGTDQPGFQSVISLNNAETTLMTSDGCYESPTYHACSHGFDQLFSRGLHAVLQQYTDTLLEIVNYRLSPAGMAATPEERLAIPLWTWVDEISPYIFEQLTIASELRISSMTDFSTNFSSQMQTIGGLFITAVLLSYFIVFAPMIRNVDVTLKRTREMLLFFPDEVVMGVSAIKKLMQDYARNRVAA